MNYTVETVVEFCEGTGVIVIPGSMVTSIIIDHREQVHSGTLFVAIKGAKADGHDFIPALIERGVRHFLISKKNLVADLAGQANFIVADDVIGSLQRFAAAHRRHMNIPVIGITGSNGKTIIKEWLHTLLEGSFRICRSPKSYNSQIGAAVSVLQLEPYHTLGIFEAGISQPGEMARLESVIQPTIGLFSNLGDAHDAHFGSREEKREEKFLLFKNCTQVIYCADQPWVQHAGQIGGQMNTGWSMRNESAGLYVRTCDLEEDSTRLTITDRDSEWTIRIPFTDYASIENALHCFAALHALNQLDPKVLSGFERLAAVAMRMEVKKGIEDSILIDDSYNSDLGSLRASLHQLQAQRDRRKLVIISDMQDNAHGDSLYSEIARLLHEVHPDAIEAIGPEIARYRALFEGLPIHFHSDADAFWQQLDRSTLRGKAILLKGARGFRLERLTRRLQAQQHETVLEINLQKLGENLRYYRSQVRPEVRIMVMVKAFGYGSGGFEVAGFLQNQQVDYLAVAYADEGVSLRQHGVHMPIMVMSPGKTAYESMIRFDLEPEIYSLRSLHEFVETGRSMRHLFETLRIHIKIDSGMHRLGFSADEVTSLLAALKEAPFVRVVSVFTHLSAADDEAHDAFTHAQVNAFTKVADTIESSLGHSIFRHVLNSTGILRFPDYQFDMVRLGIGLYGFAGVEERKFLHALGVLKSYIIQIREVEAGDSVGYNRSGVSDRRRRIATVAVGYADGLDRRLGKGRWSVRWQGVPCPIVGDICMDMCMVDVSDCEAREGDEVVVFEGSADIEAIATILETIPYEILTKVSQRVRRVYLQE